MQVLLGGLQHVVDADVADALAIRLPIVLLLPGELVVRKSPGDLASGGEESRKDLDLVVLGRVQLLGRDLVVLHALDFFDHDRRRLRTGGIARLEAGRERARVVRARLEARIGAVRQALVRADAHHDAGREAAPAQDGIHDAHLEGIGVEAVDP